MKILPFLLLLLTGCYSLKYLPYSGDQQEWPVASGSFIATNGALPCYYGYPPRAYVVLAQIEVNSGTLLVDAMRVAASTARQNGADALCVLDDAARYGGSIGSGAGFGVANGRTVNSFGAGSSTAVYLSSAKVIAIKFK